MSDRDIVLKGLPESSLPPTIHPRGIACVRDPSWSLFRERLAELGGHVVELDQQPYGDCLIRRLDELGIRSSNFYLDPDAGSLLKMQGSGDVWDVDVGVTCARSAIAETGSVVVEAGAGCRLASLAPPCHVALVCRDAIRATLEDALPHGVSRTTVMVTGPSRTADIEGILVRGVHGPKHVVVAIIDG